MRGVRGALLSEACRRVVSKGDWSCSDTRFELATHVH